MRHSQGVGNFSMIAVGNFSVDVHKWGVRSEIAAQKDGWRYLVIGSAQGRVGVVELEEELFLHAEALLMAKLPSDKDLIVPLMRELLEKNVFLPESAKFAIVNDSVLVLITRPLRDLSSEEISGSIAAVMAVADKLDDKFLLKYGGTNKKRRF